MTAWKRVRRAALPAPVAAGVPGEALAAAITSWSGETLTMRWVATLLATTILLAAPAGLAQADAGDLDPSFDGDGKRTLNYGGMDVARAVMVQPDGKIVVAGSGGADQDFTVSRLHPDGSLDSSFDGDGTAIADFGGNDEAYAAALQPGGEIIVAGSGEGSMAVARFRPNGSLDASFDPGGTDGPGKKLFGAESSLATAVQVQLDGRIVLARGGSNGNDNDFGVTRLNPDGSVDSTTFDLADFGGSESPAAAALQPDGKIVLAGTTYPPQQGSPPRVAVARYDVDGSLDQTFGGTGKTTLEFGSSNNVAATAVHVQPGGKLVVSGYGTDDIDFVVARLNSDGTPDGAFGTGGTSTIDFGLIEVAMAAVLQPDGKIVLAGGAQPSATDWDFGAARLLPGGALDATFGNGGKTTVPSGPIEFANAAALQPDGKIVLAGYTQGAQQNVALVRLEGVTPSAAGGGGAGAGPGGPSADRTAPILSRFSASPRRFRAGRRTSAAVKRARRNTKLTLVLSERASVRFDAFAVSTGRRVGTRCRKATRSNRKRNRCTLRVRKGGFSRSFDAGASNLAFRGRVGKRTLAPGRYSLRATPTDAAGNTGKPRAVALRLVD